MPKPKAGFVRKLNLLAKEFENECVVIDNGINGNLFCSACGINLGSTRFLVKQHVETKKHLSNRALKSKQLTLPTLVKKDEFSMELFQVIFSLLFIDLLQRYPNFHQTNESSIGIVSLLIF